MFGKKKDVSVLDQYKKKQINLLPDLYFKKKKRLRMAFAVLTLVVAVAVAFTYHLIDLQRQLNETKANNALILQVIEEKSEERNRQYLLTALDNRIEYKSNLLKEIEAENTSVLYVTEVIESVLPQDVFYVSVDFDSTESMTIYGKTETKEEIPDLLHKIRSLNLFHELSVESINRTEEINYKGVEEKFEFVLKCSFGGDTDEVD